jgi:hypothetical protein
VAPAVAENGDSSIPGPTLEYRPPRPALPEPKEPIPAPPVTLFREAIGKFGISTGSFDGPIDVATDREGNFYALDAGNNRVQKFDKSSNFILTFGSFGSRPGEFNNPRAIAISPGGLIYVVDTGNNRIQQFTPDGTIIKTWGELGSRHGNFKYPNDITFENDTTLWVLDAGNERAQRFRFERGLENAGDLRYVSEIGSSFAERGSNFKGLVSLAWSSDRFGYLYLLSAGCLVQQFQPDGNLEKSWSGVAPESGLCVPARIEIDKSGTNDYVYVLDAGNGLLIRFNLDGRFLAALRGAERLFSQPLGFAVNPARDEVFIADTKNNIIQKFILR